MVDVEPWRCCPVLTLEGNHNIRKMPNKDAALCWNEKPHLYVYLLQNHAASAPTCSHTMDALWPQVIPLSIQVLFKCISFMCITIAARESGKRSFRLSDFDLECIVNYPNPIYVMNFNVKSQVKTIIHFK